ncbi:MAG: hypothetical protein HYU77_06170 [Betaproteobacteria bacterium]|nr:hypothetical protein [Betaproteobacteria bacterium]
MNRSSPTGTALTDRLRAGLYRLGAGLVLAVLGALALGMTLAWAEVPLPVAPIWHCWLRDGPVYNVVCMPGTLPDAPGAPAGESGSQGVAAAQTADWAFAKTRLMRANPEDFGPTVWVIPIYTLPYDQDAVVQLLRIVLCPGNRDCRIAYLGEIS